MNYLENGISRPRMRNVNFSITRNCNYCVCICMREIWKPKPSCLPRDAWKLARSWLHSNRFISPKAKGFITNYLPVAPPSDQCVPVVHLSAHIVKTFSVVTITYATSQGRFMKIHNIVSSYWHEYIGPTCQPRSLIVLLILDCISLKHSLCKPEACKKLMSTLSVSPKAKTK